jgi:hypothetical protein
MDVFDSINRAERFGNCHDAMLAAHAFNFDCFHKKPPSIDYFP